jgi:peptidoglycan/LPS O-acetylase OafA/YrhL
MQPTAHTEMRAVTGLRGIAALYVVIYHACNAIANHASAPQANAAKAVSIAALIQHGYIAVDLFFVLSGFVMAATYGSDFDYGISWASYLRFIGRRLARIYPLYIVCTLVFGVVVISRAADPKPVTLTLLWNVLLVQSWGLAPSINGPAWSISVEWAAYFLFPLLLWLTICRRQVWALVVGAVCLLTLAGIAYAPDWLALGQQEHRRGLLDLVSPFSVAPLLRCLAGFVLGLLGWRFRDRALTQYASLLTVVALLLLCVERTDIPVVAMFAFLVPAVSTGKALITRILSSGPIHRLGVLSYSIYLLHPHFSAVERRVSQAAYIHGVPQAGAQAVGTLVGIVVAVFGASLVYRVIEQPCRQVARRILDRTLTATADGVRLPSAPYRSDPLA